MARKRMIDQRIWQSEQVMSLSSDQFKLYIYLISQADDEGRFKVPLKLIKAIVFPLKSYGEKRSLSDLRYMAELGLIYLYHDDSSLYIEHPNWRAYQWLSHPVPSKLPSYKDLKNTSGDLRKLPDDTGELLCSKSSFGEIEREKEYTTTISSTKKKYAESVLLTEAEYGKLCVRFGSDQTKKLIEKLNNYKLEKGKTYKSDYHAILTWVVDALGIKEQKIKGWKCPECGKLNTHVGRYCLNPKCEYEFIEKGKK